MNKKYVLDTNILLDNPQIIQKYDCILLSSCLRELDKHKSNLELGYKAREASRYLDKHTNDSNYDLKDYKFTLNDQFDPQYFDNQILQACVENGYGLITDDILLRQKAKGFGIEIIDLNNVNNDDDYLGYKEVIMDDFEMVSFYECRVNKWNLLENEYLIIKDQENEVKDRLKWTNKGFKSLDYKTIDSRYVDKVKPRNLQQELMFDLLQDNKTKIKVVTGGYGTGKDFIGLSTFLNYLDKGKFSKIIWVRNNIEALTGVTKQIGYLPGSVNEKLAVFADLVSDFLGGKIGFDSLINAGKLEIVHTGFLRGRDFRNSLIYCTESQNMTKELIQLIVSRISENTMIYFNGDVKQTDASIFKQNNGLNAMINTFKGNPNFGFVKLEKTERSEIAEMASLLG